MYRTRKNQSALYKIDLFSVTVRCTVESEDGFSD